MHGEHRHAAAFVESVADAGTDTDAYSYGGADEDTGSDAHAQADANRDSHRYPHPDSILSRLQTSLRLASAAAAS